MLAAEVGASSACPNAALQMALTRISHKSLEINRFVKPKVEVLLF
jgi:hypothetical protein